MAGNDLLNKELYRKSREESIAQADSKLRELDSSLMQSIRNSHSGEDMQEKYIRYRLQKIDPQKDKVLYSIMYLLMNDHEWEPTEKQKEKESNIFSDIQREMYLFADDAMVYRYLQFGSGEILLYFAEKLAYDTELTVARACEMLLENCGIYLVNYNQMENSPYNEITDEIKSAILYSYRSALSSDELEEPECSMFNGPDYWDYLGHENRFNGYGGMDYIPDWFTQYQVYLSNLMDD